MALELSHALCETVTDEASSIISGFAEVGLDAIMKDGLLKDIPFISTAISLYKIGTSIHDRHYIQKLTLFLNAINERTASEEEKAKLRNRINKNPAKSSAEIEYLLVVIDRFIELDKPSLLAKLYLAYLDGKLSWSELTQYSVVIDRFLPGDLQILNERKIVFSSYNSITAACLRLIAQGLMVEYVHDPRITGRMKDPTDISKRYEVTRFGEKLISILL